MLDAAKYQNTKDEKYISIIDGDLIIDAKINK
jgi:hypothetical protein